MAKVTYTGNAAVWRTAAYGGVSVRGNETIEVEDAAADWLVGEHDFEYADATPDEDEEDGRPKYSVLRQNVPEVEEAIETGNFDDRLDDLEAAESEADDRAGVHDAIEERRDALDESEE